MVSVPVRREQVAYATRRGLSQRRSCTLMKVARSTLGYRSAKAVRDAPVLARMAVLSAQYPRYGYRRLHVLLRREGWEINIKRTYRLYRIENLIVRRRRKRKSACQLRVAPAAPLHRTSAGAWTSWPMR